MPQPPSPSASLRLQEAANLLTQGRAGEAASHLRPLAASLPELAPARMLLGLALKDLGQLQPAEVQLRAAWKLDPGSGPAAVNLSNLLLSAGRAQEALEATTRLAASRFADTHVLSAHGAALKALGRWSEAIDVCARAVAAAPQSGVAEHNLAGALGDAERFAESEAAARRAFAKGLDAPETWLVLARANVGQSRFDEAESAYRQVLARRSDYAEALTEFAQLLWMRSEDVTLAVAPFDQAIAAHPDLQTLLVRKAELLEYAGDLEGAYETVAGAAMRPDADAALHVTAARLSMRRDLAEALNHANRAVALTGGDRVALGTLCEAYLANGEADLAAGVALGLRQRDPFDQHAVGLLAAAWRLAGDRRYGNLHDYQSLVRTWTIETPQGWPNLPAFLADLTGSLDRLHTLRTHPIGQSVRHGSQTSQSLTLVNDPVIRAFFKAIDGPIRRHIDELGRGDDILRSRIAGGYGFNGAWSIKLRPGGFHANHLHPMGWLSSACYIALPSAVRTGRQGWLKFGEPGVVTAPDLAAEHFVEPEPGLLALFPSYMWHGTVPFSGDESRLTIAFDVVPTPSSPMTKADVNPNPSLAEIEAAAQRPETRSHAIDLAINALGNGLETPLVLGLVAQGLEEDGRGQDAINLSYRATIVAPKSLEAHLEFSLLLYRLGHRQDALNAVRAALELDPGCYEAQLHAAAVLVGLNEFKAAARHAEAAADLRSEAAEPISTLAIIAARLDDYPRARSFAERALTLRPGLSGPEIVMARVELDDNRPLAAISRLQRLLARTDLVDGHRAEALSLLGDCQDAAGEPARAFAAYAAGNQVMARRIPADIREGQSALDQARGLERYFSVADRGPWRLVADRGPWRLAAGDDRAGRRAAGHVFLIGFPRSGTTLLENALASHPDVLALEESDALAIAAGDLMANDAAFDHLAQLSDDEAVACRQAYWRRVDELLPLPANGKVFIDKMPTGAVALPFIAKVFPSAKILFARRDPRDVVLSCFRRLFGANTVMAEFVTLEGAARYYDQVMRDAELFADLLATPTHVIRHEDVVANFDRELGGALAFIGLEWSLSVRDFAGRAIGAKTPSAVQLARGLNDNGVGAWRRFGRQMAPIMPILEPWVRKFGYPATEASLIPPAPDPRFEPLRAEISRAVAAGDWPAAFTHTDDAFAQGFTDPLLFRVRGVRGQQDGRLDEAVADFETALALAPGDVALLGAIGLSLARSGRALAGLARLDEAIALNPGVAANHFNRGFALELLGELDAAREAYERAIALDPRHAQAMGALAALAARAADWERTRLMGLRALAIDPRQPAAHLAMTDQELARGQPVEAERRLRALLAAPRANDHERAIAHQKLGDTFDVRRRFDEAFDAYGAAAGAMRQIHWPRFAALGLETSSTIAERLLERFAAVPMSAWRSEAPPDDHQARRLVFLVGFPRSGTTMTGQILARHPQIATLEETDALGEAARRFLGGDADLAALASLAPGEAEEMRQAYWRAVGLGALDPSATVIVDKLPMNLLALPVIARLFPAAKILLMRRDPRDVVFSCFRRQFAINPTTIELLRLEDAARLYDLTMRLVDAYLERLPLDVRAQGYEDLVTDFNRQGRGITDFIGIDWRGDMADFSGAAAKVATPSSAQLARGLTDETIGHWRFYKQHLAPALPLLEPWALRFGYPLS